MLRRTTSADCRSKWALNVALVQIISVSSDSFLSECQVFDVLFRTTVTFGRSQVSVMPRTVAPTVSLGIALADALTVVLSCQMLHWLSQMAVALTAALVLGLAVGLNVRLTVAPTAAHILCCH